MDKLDAMETKHYVVKNAPENDSNGNPSDKLLKSCVSSERNKTAESKQPKSLTGRNEKMSLIPATNVKLERDLMPCQDSGLAYCGIPTDTFHSGSVLNIVAEKNTEKSTSLSFGDSDSNSGTNSKICNIYMKKSNMVGVSSDPSKSGSCFSILMTESKSKRSKTLKKENMCSKTDSKASFFVDEPDFSPRNNDRSKDLIETPSEPRDAPEDTSQVSGSQAELAVESKETLGSSQDKCASLRYSRNRPTSLKRVDSEGFACRVCGMAFESRRDYDNHYRTHEKKLFQCDKCGKVFVDKSKFIIHYRKHTGEKPFVCGICYRAFARKDTLKLHLALHSGYKPHTCEVCDTRFAQKKDLDLHCRIHSGERPYECEICNKRFAQKKDLNIHFRIHTGERPYECEICNKRFVRKSDLKIHYISHSSKKDFECKVCNKLFARTGALRRHYRTHTGEKPFSCDVCNKVFTRKENLNQHLKTHSNDKPFVCDICNNTFVRRDYLRKHYESHDK